jgi:hypothetical protein
MGVALASSAADAAADGTVVARREQQRPRRPPPTRGWNFGTQPYPYVPSETPDDITPLTPPSVPPNFDMAVGTKFPLGFGPELTVELPGRLLLAGEVGWMPAAYGSTIAGFIDSFGKEGAVIGPIVEEALANSWVLALSAGWRPLADWGFELVGGYLTIGVDGEVPMQTVADLLPVRLRREVMDSLTAPIEVGSQLHHFHVGLGWRWLAYDNHLVIRARLGYTQAVASTSEATLPGFEELQSRVNPELDARLDQAITNDVKLPMLGLNAGYRF